jgi:hypothetical protein
MLGSTYATLRKAAHKHPVVVLVAGRGHAFALIMSSAAQDQPHALRLEINSDELSALRVSAEQAGLRSRADMRDREPGTRIRYQKTETDDNHKSHQVLREIWRKITLPVLRYLQLEVSMHNNEMQSSSAHTYGTESNRSISSSSSLVCKRRLCLPPTARCGHLLRTPGQSRVLFRLHRLVVHSDCFGSAPSPSQGPIGQVLRREHAPRRRRLGPTLGPEQAVERPERADVR